jgi:hypothetical protein
LSRIENYMYSEGDPSRIPPVGQLIPIVSGIEFRVEAYGDSEEINLPLFDFINGRAIGEKPTYRLTLVGSIHVETDNLPVELYSWLDSLGEVD